MRVRADILTVTERGTLMENKKVQVVHLQIVKDDEVVYGSRKMDNPREAAELMKEFSRGCGQGVSGGVWD